MFLLQEQMFAEKYFAFNFHLNDLSTLNKHCATKWLFFYISIILIGLYNF